MTPSNVRERADQVQNRAERAVAAWIDRVVEDGRSFVGSEDEERFAPLSSLLGDLLRSAVEGDGDGGDAALLRAGEVADQLEAYSLGAEGMRARARSAHEDIMARREASDAPLAAFLAKYEELMTALHAIATSGSSDLGADLLAARELLLEAEDVARNG